LFNDPLSTVVYDNDGLLLGARISSDGQWRFEQSDSIPQKYIDCLIQYEDKRYYYHFGIDPLGIFGAIKHNLSKKNRRGGSTIPMQVMRMAFKKNKRNVFSKIKESLLSVYLTIRFKKSTVLKIYAANAPFGGNVVGMEAACWRYFGKAPHLLTWAEAATLAVLPNAPSLINVGKNRSSLKLKRDGLLKKMLENNAIDSATYVLSIEEPLPDKPIPLPSYTPHLIDRLNRDKNEIKSHSTTLDKDIQNFCIETAEYYQDLYTQNQINNIAIIVVENETGHVLSYVGNTSKKVKGAAVDMINAKRSSGSILKPILFTALLDEARIAPKSLLPDIPISINGYSPQNFDKSFHGAIGSDEALQRSLNIPFVIKLREYGISKFLNLTRKVGITSLNKSADHYGLSLILGGGEVTLWELCGVYSSMARTLNHFTTSQSKYSSKDWHMPMITNNKSQNKKFDFSPTLFRAGSIYQCFEALKGLKRPDEEGLWEEFSSSKNISWKTGTSFGHKDAWAIGLDKTYTVGIWVGNADGTSRANLTGINTAAPVLFDVFNRLPSSNWFQKPWDDLSKQIICRKSGHIASTNCSTFDTTYINLSSKEIPLCSYHQIKYLSSDEKFQVNAQCYPQDDIVAKSFFILVPEQATFYKNSHPDYLALPDFHPECTSQFGDLSEAQFAILYPNEYTKIFIGKDVTGKDQSAIFRATHNDPNGILYWHIDKQYIGKTEKYHSIEVKILPGKHKLVVMDEKGNQKWKWFEVEG
jgi:penicillin-binding protein 1C